MNSPDKAVDLIGTHLRPPRAVAPQRLRQLILDLDDPSFPVRQAAARELATLGTKSEAALRQALAPRPSPEARRSLIDLIEALERWEFSAEQLRYLRAIQVLEWIGSPSARKVLATLASGEPSARETEQAKGALKRLENRLKHP